MQTSSPWFVICTRTCNVYAGWTEKAPLFLFCATFPLLCHLKPTDTATTNQPTQAQATVLFKTSSSFNFNPEDGTYTITLEVPCALSMVLLQSSVHVDVVDLDGKNAAIMTKCPPPAAPSNNGKKSGKSSSSKLLASYRCAEPMKRIEMGIRTVEGQFGTVQAFVIADLEPRKAQIVKFEVKPLSLHAKVDADTLEPPLVERALTSLTFSGNFSIRQMHEWMMQLFPNYTSHLPKDCLLYTSPSPRDRG